jgi:hypothetical protein
VPAQVVGTGDAKPDGSHPIYIALEPGADPIEVNVPLEHVEQLVQRFQLAAFRRIQVAVQNAALPTLHAYGVQTAHAGPDTQLMVATEETAAVVVEASDDLLRHMKIEIDRVLSFRSGSASKN